MRRLFLPFVLAAAAVASPAAAQTEGFLCLGVTTSGHRLPPASTGVHCIAEDYRYRIICNETYVGVQPGVGVDIWSCVPGG